MSKTSPFFKTVAALLIPASLLAVLLPAEVLAIPKAQQDCTAALAEAERQYNNGRFDDVIETLEDCLPEEIPHEEKSKAYRLLSLSYLAKDYIEQARQSIEKILELAPAWKPDPIQDPPPFTQMVEEVRNQMQARQAEQPAEQPAEAERQPEQPPAEIIPPPKKGGSKAFLWIGLGAVAIGGGLIAALSGGGGGNGPAPIVNGPDRLPDPPGDPGGN